MKRTRPNWRSAPVPSTRLPAAVVSTINRLSLAPVTESEAVAAFTDAGATQDEAERALRVYRVWSVSNEQQ